MIMGAGNRPFVFFYMEVNMRRFKHLSFTDRLRIEAHTKDGKTPREVAEIIGVHISTVYRELQRGRYQHLNSDLTTEERYSPDIAHKRYKQNLADKGPQLKIGNDHNLAAYIEYKIIDEQYSPAAVLGEIKAQGLYFETSICVTTLYSYIDKEIFLGLTNKALPVKGTRRRKYQKVERATRAPRGESIEKRPEEVNTRTIFGHWEMDCVEGKKKSKKTLLVLTERVTRKEIIIPMQDQTAASVKAALDRLERKYGRRFKIVFKSITVDNGSEFSDCAGMERSINGKDKRTIIYYCHPYSAYERGSNENLNRMIRRRFPKGTDFGKVTAKQIKQSEEWINRYPRKIHGFRSSGELFQEQIAAIR